MNSFAVAHRFVRCGAASNLTQQINKISIRFSCHGFISLIFLLFVCLISFHFCFPAQCEMHLSCSRFICTFLHFQLRHSFKIFVNLQFFLVVVSNFYFFPFLLFCTLDDARGRSFIYFFFLLLGTHTLHHTRNAEKVRARTLRIAIHSNKLSLPIDDIM